jgi:hypothetical protein
MLLPTVRAKQGPSGKHHDPPSPMADHVAEVRDQILTSLLAWVWGHMSAKEGYRPIQVMPSMRDLWHYLTVFEEEILSNPNVAGDYVHDVQRLAHLAQRTAAPDRREGVVIAVHSSNDCAGGNVWARSIHDKGRCTECGRTEPVSWWHHHYPPSPDDPLTDAEAAAYVAVAYGLTVTMTTVRSWRHRGLIDVHRDERGIPKKHMNMIATPRKSLDDYIHVREVQKAEIEAYAEAADRDQADEKWAEVLQLLTG